MHLDQAKVIAMEIADFRSMCTAESQLISGETQLAEMRLRVLRQHNADASAHIDQTAYGTAAALAGPLGLRKDPRSLHQTLKQQERSDAVLTDIAKGEVNRDAAAT